MDLTIRVLAIVVPWGVVAYGVWRVTRTAEAVVDRWATAFAPVRPAPAIPTPLPQDLLALALSHTEDWAREETMKAMRERYELTPDWNAVRAAFGVGARSDDAAVALQGAG